jgi:hypothetical protein
MGRVPPLFMTLIYASGRPFPLSLWHTGRARVTRVIHRQLCPAIAMPHVWMLVHRSSRPPVSLFAVCNAATLE